MRPLQRGAAIKVVGIGGAGGSAVQRMIDQRVEGVECIVVDTDAQALAGISGGAALRIGAERTEGAGGSAHSGRRAAAGDRERIAEALHGADMAFVVAGMGGGTGTGAAPVVAEIASKKGLLTVGVVTRPCISEGRARQAERGIGELMRAADAVIVIPNDKPAAGIAADGALLDAVRGIADIIQKSSPINIYFDDVRAVMRERGPAVMGSGRKSGAGRAEAAAREAVGSPLLDGIDIGAARAVLVNVSAKSLSREEWTAVGAVVADRKAEDAAAILGTVQDDALGEDLRVTVIATGVRARQGAEVFAIADFMHGSRHDT